MYSYLNLHPQQKLVRDCVKRSLTLLTERPYEQVSKELNDLKKETKCKKFNSNKNWKIYVQRLGWEKFYYPSEKGKPRMNGERFCISHPKGKFLLRMAHHLTAVIDGVIYDTWDCSQKCVYNAWEVRSDTCLADLTGNINANARDAAYRPKAKIKNENHPSPKKHEDGRIVYVFGYENKRQRKEVMDEICHFYPAPLFYYEEDTDERRISIYKREYDFNITERKNTVGEARALADRLYDECQTVAIEFYKGGTKWQRGMVGTFLGNDGEDIPDDVPCNYLLMDAEEYGETLLAGSDTDPEEYFDCRDYIIVVNVE